MSAKKRDHDASSSSSSSSSSSKKQAIAPSATPDGGQRKVVVLLDKASLATTKTRAGDFELLNCDDHQHIARKNGLDPAAYRPDILHQELLALIDSPLNKAGHLKVYIHTTNHVLIEVNPKVRIPRTFKRFSGLMVQLLHKLKIRSSTNSEVLLKVIKNPFSNHMPAGSHVYGFSVGGTLYNPRSFAERALPDDGLPLVLVFGAMATGAIKAEDHPYIEQMVSISNYPLSGAAALSRICGAIEGHWGIV